VSEDLRSLTRRELQVAVFVAGGLSDREVGERLSITRRTAEWHVEQILAKLDLKSRSQIASRVTQAEAFGSPLLAGGRSPRDVQPQLTAVIGFNTAVTHELLATTRSLDDAPFETDAARRDRLMALAEAGYNPVVATGVTYAVALGQIAKAYPNTQFAIVDDSSLSVNNKNVTGLVFADHEGSYLVGAIAAQASKTGIIGFIGGVDLPSIRRFLAGYAAGAKVVRRDINMHVRFLTDPPDFSGFCDRANGKAAADGMYQNGADVVYHAAGGSGTGVFQAAKEACALAIGVDSDQYMTAAADIKPFVLTSMVKRVEDAVKNYVDAYVRKDPLPRMMTFDLANGGVGYSKSNPLVQAYVATTDDLQRQIVAGHIRVPETP
jgi:basic membrane protein A and related proteins